MRVAVAKLEKITTLGNLNQTGRNGLFHVALLNVVLCGAGMKRNVFGLPYIMDVVGKDHIAPLEKVLPLINCFRNGVHKIIWRIGTAIYHCPATNQGPNRMVYLSLGGGASASLVLGSPKPTCIHSGAN